MWMQLLIFKKLQQQQQQQQKTQNKTKQYKWNNLRVQRSNDIHSRLTGLWIVFNSA